MTVPPPLPPVSATIGFDRMARIAVFSLTFDPFIGGAEVAIAEIARRLSAHSLTVFTARLRPDLPAMERIGAVTVVRVGRGRALDKYRYPWLAVSSALAEHRQQPFDLIWGMMASWGGLAALQFKAKHPAVPYVLTEQSGDSDAFIARRTWFWRWRYRQIYTRADAVTAISHFLAGRAKRYGARAVTVVPNGVDVAHFSRRFGSEALERLRKRAQLTEGPYVITVSRLVKKNGLDDLIAAVALLRQRQVKVDLLLVGVGPLEDRLQAHVRRLGVPDAVKFIGFADHAELPMLLQFALAFVRPSRSEGFGNALVEAMAAGVPVVATPVGGIVDFLEDGRTGLFCQPNNPPSIADAIARLLGDQGLRDQLVANARRMVEQRYDWPVVAAKMQSVFAHVISSRQTAVSRG